MGRLNRKHKKIIFFLPSMTSSIKPKYIFEKRHALFLNWQEADLDDRTVRPLKSKMI